MIQRFKALRFKSLNFSCNFAQRFSLKILDNFSILLYNTSMDNELIVKPQLDVIFKKLFVENPELLANFLSYALNMSLSELSDIDIINPEIIPESFGEKFARLDLVIKHPDGTKINVELQNANEYNYKERSVFNCSKLFTRDLMTGDDYADIAKTICINIVQFDLFPEADVKCTVYPTVQETGEIVTPKWEIIYYQTKKLGDTIDGSVTDWLKFFTVKTEKELTFMEKTNNPAVLQAVVKIREMNDDDRAKEMARIREKAFLTEQSMMAGTLQKGIWIGREEGREEGIGIGSLKSAYDMYKFGMPLDTISKATGIPAEKIMAFQPTQKSEVRGQMSD
jgi:predicted transposase/invertase (TIGR01784 family)